MTALDILLRWCQDQGVLVPEPAAVLDYLTEYPTMRPIVASVCRSAVEHFRGQAQLSLDIYVDPDIETREVTLYVRQASYDVDILQRLDALNAASANAVRRFGGGGWILVTTDFCPPHAAPREGS